MKKEVGLYLFIGLLAVGVFLAAYYLNLGITGFSVFEQNNEATFNEGVYENVVYDQNLSVIVLGSNQTTGSYTSKIFDASGEVSWDNITFEGSDALDFEVTTCSDANCSDANFSNVDLADINMTSQYFQYRVNFNSAGANETLSLTSVSIESSSIVAPVQTSVVVTGPSGSKSSSTGILLNFSVAGEGLTCLYSIHDSSDNAVIQDNTSISGCSSLTFDLGAGEGDYIINVYASGSSGSASDSSEFSIDLPSSSTEEEEEEFESTVQVPVTASASAESAKVTQITASDISEFKLTPGGARQVRLIVKNTGTEPVSACALKFGADSASWISVLEESINLNTGDSHEFIFVVNVPEDTEDGSHSFSASTECSETSAAKEFTLNVERKKLEFDVIDAQRTRTDRVRVVYSLEELTGEDQNVSVHFSILDSGNKEVANFSENKTIDANSTDEFNINIPVNESLEGNFSLSATVNSEVYETSVLEPIILGAPVGGFAVFGEGLGTGSILVLVIVVFALAVAFFVARRMRKSGKTLKDFV